MRDRLDPYKRDHLDRRSTGHLDRHNPGNGKHRLEAGLTQANAKIRSNKLPANLQFAWDAERRIDSGGEGGIRTHEALASPPVFKTGAFNRSATSPFESTQALTWILAGNGGVSGAMFPFCLHSAP